jgi:hypothetical protein
MEMERERRLARSGQRAAGEDWNLGALAEALPGAPEASTDLALGAGTRFRLGPEQSVALELFPAAGVVRLSTPDLQIVLARQERPPDIAASGLVFTRDEHGHRALAVSWEGTLTLVASPPDDPAVGPRTAPGGAIAPQRPAGPLAGVTGPSGDPGASGTPVPEVVPTPVAAAESDRPADVLPSPASAEGATAAAAPAPRGSKERPGHGRVEGNLVAPPVFRVSSHQRRELTVFVVAEHYTDADGTPQSIFHKCVAFNTTRQRLADLVRDAARPGDAVVVHGAWHDVPVRSRDGGERRERQLWAYGVKITPHPGPRPPTEA